MKNMKLGMKIGLGFGTILLLLALIGLTGWWNVNSVSGTAVKTLKGDAKIAEYSARARANINAMRRYEKDVFLNITSKQKVEEYFKKWKDQHDRGKERIAAMEAIVYLQQEKDHIKMINEDMAAYEAGFEGIYKMISAGQITTPDAGNEALNKYKDPIHRLEETIKTFSDDANKRMAGIVPVIEASASKTSWFMIIFGTVAMIVGVLLAFFLTRAITRPINLITAGLSDGSEQVAAASAQVSTSSQQLAEGSSEQAASLEETSSSIEELSSMTKQNADNAQQAKAMMKDASRIVENVNTNMKNMAEAIADVTKSSEETSKIIKTIDEIAFQTNLLALNAAVEAARAGEAGAGFAVVADEVRNLAMRAAEAAKNTSDLIENTIKGVKNGNELTRLTQEAFKENMEISGKIGSLIDEIAAASQEQAHGINQINIAVAEMDKVVQRTAANAEESASASEEMNAQAEQMKGYVYDLMALIGGNQNGLADGSHFKPSMKKQVPLAHANEEAMLPVPNRRSEIKTLTPRKGKVVRPDQVIPMEEGKFKDF